ncbi:MAG TPA: DUF4118 domain-containing protein [Thermoanaerobaculia bacterium]|nr:DUF4118 domain-containing protein [Thermoanaerobaculia bacterium]
MPAAVAVTTILGRLGGANAATIGLLYFALVLVLAAWGGWRVGGAASLLVTLCLNYFFLPPVGTLTVADPANWVALVCLLGGSALAARLVTAAREQAAHAQAKSEELDALYRLSLDLSAAGPRRDALGEAVNRTLAALGARDGALLLPAGPGRFEPAGGIGDPAWHRDSAALLRALASGRPAPAQAAPGPPVTYLPLDVGGAVVGVLLAVEPTASPALLSSAGRLLGLALERERLLAQAARGAALRESEQLKTGLLRALSHDLRTPLTAMRIDAESLAGRLPAGDAAARASLASLSLELERLSRRIDNLLALARLEAGLAQPRPEPLPAQDLFRAACDSQARLLGERRVERRVAADCPDLWVDPSLALEVLANLLENAARAAPPSEPIELAALPDPGSSERVRLEVLDRGPGVPEEVRRRFEAPLGRASEAAAAPDRRAGGLGLEIVHGLVGAIGGGFRLLDRSGGGTVARLELPAAPVVDVPGAPA